MALKADGTDRSLWTPNDARKAGVHALIIGVSEYPHLADGSAPPSERAPDNGGLGQLEVCAKTAAKVFHWLSATGEVAGAPIATCRLLLAPRAGERAEVDHLTGGAYGRADFASVRKAAEDWGDSILAGGTESDVNVAFFFFSGHGTEYMASPALLASDILNPRSAVGSHKAIGFFSLCQAVKTYGIDRALLFVDACRDVPAVARTLHIVGEDILKPYAYPPKSHEALICLQSTRSGGSAYQVAGAPATIFGQAVLDALDGPPPSFQPYDTTTRPWRLVFRNLESHVKQRVRELLSQQTATLIQAVVPYGDPYYGEMLVAEKRGPQPVEVAVPSVEALIATRSADILRGFKTFAASELASRRTAAINPNGDLGNSEVMHDIFMHESVTDPWTRTLRILDVETGQPVAADTVQVSEASSQEVGGTLTAWVDVRVRPDHGRAIWLAAGGENGKPSFAVTIPRDLNAPVPARLDVAFQQIHPHDWTMTTMSARVGAPSAERPTDEVTRVWSALWEIQRHETLSDLDHAGMAASELAVLEKALGMKTASPVAAAIASTVLLRSGAFGQLHDWPRNLANWFEWLPDGALLWAETLLRRDGTAVARSQGARAQASRAGAKSRFGDDAEEVRRLAGEPAYAEARLYFAKLADRGPPRLASSLAMAARQTWLWRRVLESGAVDGQASLDLTDACDVVERAAAYAVSEGLFAGFASSAGVLAPDAVIGKRSKAAARQNEAGRAAA